MTAVSIPPKVVVECFHIWADFAALHGGANVIWCKQETLVLATHHVDCGIVAAPLICFFVLCDSDCAVFEVR